MSFVFQCFINALQPRANESAGDWLRQFYFTHIGEAFSEEQVPWITAPQGPCWAWDSIQFRLVWLQWAARMFKTNFGLGMLMRSMDQRPEETMFGTPDERTCKAIFGRLWKMIDHCPRLSDQAPHEQKRNKTRIDLKRAVLHGAWPRGKALFADKSIRIGHGNEISKWVDESTSKEGKALMRFQKRGSEYPDRTFLMESTPSVRGKCDVEAGRLESTNHRYHVPCPHCCKFQTIEFGDEDQRPGTICWESKDGFTDREHAKATAFFKCLHCSEAIHDIHRPEMMNRGVWVPAGCKVDHDRAMDARNLPPDDMSWLRGEPDRWGDEYGSQLSVFYALFHGWGDIVLTFLKRKKRPRDLQQWINEDKGETWEVKKTLSTPERVAARLKTDIPRGTLPEWCRLLTVTIDQQEADGGFRPFVVLAHGAEEQAHIVDYGAVETLDALASTVLGRAFPHRDGGDMRPHFSSIDSGWDTKATYDFCNTHALIVPCKGSSTDLAGKPYRLSEVEKGEYEGQTLFTVNTDFWETDLQARLDDRRPFEPGGLSLCAGAERDIDLLTQLCNAVLADKLDLRGNAKLLWVKKNEYDPNDYRDAVRYGLALAQAFVDSNNGYPPRMEVQARPQPEGQARFSSPDGRAFFVGNR